MITYPVSFFGESSTTAGMNVAWKTHASGFESTCSIPKEFEGPGSDFSPEDYYLLALKNCFVATFKVFAEYSKLSFDELNVSAELIVDRNEANRPVMKSIKLVVTLVNVSDEKKAMLLYNKTLANGLILCSVKTEIISEVHFK